VLTQRDELLKALGRLENALASPVGSGDWLDRVRAEFAGLHGRFEKHLEVTEGPDGLFEDVLEAAPRLAHHIDVLRNEHHEIDQEIEEAQVKLANAGPGELEELRHLLTALLGRLVRHRQKGADLLFEAYDTDVGGLD
jgi:hypothetical protein